MGPCISILENMHISSLLISYSGILLTVIFWWLMDGALRG